MICEHLNFAADVAVNRLMNGEGPDAVINASDGGKTFEPPECDEDGMPIGFPICAGWAAEVQAQISDERRGSEGERFPSFFRIWDRVRSAKALRAEGDEEGQA